MSFSEKMGYKPIEKPIQLGVMDLELRNSLWSLVYENVLRKYRGGQDSFIRKSNLDGFAVELWFVLWKEPTDNIPDGIYTFAQEIRQRFFDADWNEVYDIMEVSIRCYPFPEQQDRYISVINKVLVRESSAYRFVGGEFTQITSEAEIGSIEEATAYRQNTEPSRNTRGTLSRNCQTKRSRIMTTL